MELEKIENLYNLIGSYVRENDYVSLQELFNSTTYPKEKIKEALNFKNNIGENLFFQACRSRDVKNIGIVELLIENGVDPFIENNFNKTILDYDITEGMREYISNYYNDNLYNELEKCIENEDYYNLTYLLVKYKDILNRQTLEEKNKFLEKVNSSNNESLLNIVRSSSTFGSIKNQQDELDKKINNIDYRIAFNELESELITCISKADYKKMESLLNDIKYKDCIRGVLNKKNSSGESLLFNVCRNHNLRATNQRMNDEIAVKMIDLMCTNGADLFSTNKSEETAMEITTSPMLKEYIKGKQTINIYSKICSDIKNKNYCAVYETVSRYKEYLLQLYTETGGKLNLVEYANNHNDLLTQQILESLNLYKPLLQKDAIKHIPTKEEENRHSYNLISDCINKNNYELLYTICNSDEYKPYIKDALNTIDEIGETLFAQACKNGNLAIIKICLESGADAFVKNKDGKYIKDYVNINENVKKYITDYCNSVVIDEVIQCIKNKNYSKLCDLVVDYKDAILQKRIQTRNYDNINSLNLLQIAIDSEDNKAFEIIKSSGLYAENKFIGNILKRKDNLTEEEFEKIQETLTIIKDGNVDELSQLITNPLYTDCILNYKNKNYENILFDVCKNKTLPEDKAIQMIDLLVENGVNIFTTNYENKTCLEYTDNLQIKEHIQNIQKNNSYNRALTCINTENYIELEKLLSQYKDTILSKHIESNGRLNLFEFAKRKNKSKAQEIITSLQIYDNLENNQKIESPQEKIEEKKETIQNTKEIIEEKKEIVQQKPIQIQPQQSLQNKQALNQEVKDTKQKEGKLKRFFKKIKNFFTSNKKETVTTSPIKLQNDKKIKKNSQQNQINKKIDKEEQKELDITTITNNETKAEEKLEQEQIAGILSKTFAGISTSEKSDTIVSSPKISVDNIEDLIPEDLKNKLYETTRQIGDELLKQNCRSEDVEIVVKMMQDECLKKSFVNNNNMNNKRHSVMVDSL